jgi:hypothetical protein
MEYVEWCELVLQVMGKAAEESAQVRNYGIDCESLGKRIWGEHFATIAMMLMLKNATIACTTLFRQAQPGKPIA